MALSDDDERLLGEELSESDEVIINGRRYPRGWLRRKAGGRVMFVWTGLLWLLFIGLTVKAVGKANELVSIGLMLVIFVEALVAHLLSRAMWRAIGRMPRQVLRFGARFWFLMPFLFCGLLGPIMGPYLKGKTEQRARAEGVTEAQLDAGVMARVKGDEWEIIVGPGYQQATHEEAQRLCAGLGLSLPHAADLRKLSPPPSGPLQSGFWLAELESQSRRFVLASRDRTPAGFALLMEGPAEPLKAGVLCVRATSPVAEPVKGREPVPGPRRAPQLADFAAAVKSELDCSRDADVAARKPEAAALATALTCWAAAREEQRAFALPIRRLAQLAPNATSDERISSMIRHAALEGPSKPVLNALTSREAQFAELSLWEWARANPKEAESRSMVLLANAQMLPQDHEPLARLAHALAVGANVSLACEALARRALEGPWPSNLAAEAMRDVRGDCARAAAKVLYEHQRAAGFPKNLKWVEAVRALGAAAAPQVIEWDKKRGAEPVEVSSEIWGELLESELVRRNGILPPREGRGLELPEHPSLELITRACTKEDFGLGPKDALPFPDDRCVEHLDGAPLALLREGFVPLRPLSGQ